MAKGKIIVFEGIDTCGKSTVIQSLKKILPTIASNVVYSREPGNTLPNSREDNISEKIRIKVLNTPMTEEERLAYYSNSRYEHTKDMICNYLDQGINVIVDRYLLASLAYQGPLVGVDKVFESNKATLKMLQDNNVEIYNIIIDINIDTYNSRIENKIKDELENVNNETILDRMYIYSAAKDFSCKIGEVHFINGNASKQEVLKRVLSYLCKIL